MIFYSSIIIGIIIDLTSKYFTQEHLRNQINIIGNWLYITYKENTGIAFSIPIEGIILKFITIILIIGIFFYYFKYEKNKKNKLIDLSFGLILAGAIANGYERIFNSYVIDFIGVKYFSVFNLADSFIFIGVCLFIISETKIFRK